jgi:hypothetical protein
MISMALVPMNASISEMPMLAADHTGNSPVVPLKMSSPDFVGG